MAGAVASGGTVALQMASRESAGYQLTPGGVSRLVLRSVREWADVGWLKKAHWFSLLPGGPKQLKLEGLPLELHHISLPPAELRAYASTKEKIWADIHGLTAPKFDVEDFRFYSRYNWFTADALLEQVPNLDLAYVHDFQLLQMGALVGLAAPSVLRWHVPFEAKRIPSYTRNFLVRAMEDYDAVIVSSRRDLEGLLDAGFKGTARQHYPHFDSRDWPDVDANDISELENEWDLKPDDVVVLVVARMDPMKRQDLAIRAAARVRRRVPNLKLVLVGNGSFSGSGLGLTKADRWAAHLQDLARDLRMTDSVRFAHWIPDGLLSAAYARADAVLLSSDIEGFGTVLFEAWRYRRAAFITDGCGASEVITNGLNGHVFPSGDDVKLADLLTTVLLDTEAREELGAAGFQSLANFEVTRTGRRELEILQEVLARFGDA